MSNTYFTYAWGIPLTPAMREDFVPPIGKLTQAYWMITSDDIEDVRDAADVIQPVMKEYNLPPFMAEYAITGSQTLRVGQFGGGVILIAQNRVEFQETSTIMSHWRMEIMEDESDD